jgi:aminoglycoside phosphotransferase (APT) family kinase protein
MNEPILKIHWERFKAHVDLNVLTASRLLAPFTTDNISELLLLSEGCANTIYKVTFKNDRLPVVIRIYMRDQTALKREVAIHQLVADKIPVAAHLYFDESCTHYLYPYSIMEWIDGKLLREVVLSKHEKSINECMFEAGQYLSKLRQIKFFQGGFLQKNLQVRLFAKEEKYLPFVLNLLQDTIVKNDLDTRLHSAVSELVDTYSKLLPNEDEANLSHADYDPANIIVKQVNGKWKIAAILD